MKTILIPMSPLECELMARGKKTVLVRKIKPNVDTPFKCVIYMTQSHLTGDRKAYKFMGMAGKVIGEFVCDRIEEIKVGRLTVHDFICLNPTSEHFQKMSCMTEKELYWYADGGRIYGWHMSSHEIYNPPKELNQYYRPCKKYDLDEKEAYEAHCTDCGNEHGVSPCEFINQKWCLPIVSAPKGWCYIEEVTE